MAFDIPDVSNFNPNGNGLKLADNPFNQKRTRSEAARDAWNKLSAGEKKARRKAISEKRAVRGTESSPKVGS